MSFKFWIFAICDASSLQMDANMNFSMASWVSNMIISVVGCGVGTCGDGVDSISLSTLGGDTRSTLCEASLSRPICKGGPTALPTLPFVLGVGCPICCDSLILWGLVVYPWTSISIPWCLRGGPCGKCLTLGKFFTTPVFGIVVQSTSC
jgi:hypothetical protein